MGVLLGRMPGHELGEFHESDGGLEFGKGGFVGAKEARLLPGAQAEILLAGVGVDGARLAARTVASCVPSVEVDD